MSSDISLVILAAGMASRYGSTKQLQGFGQNGETIMEFSIYDAIQAGFKRIIFVIRPEFTDILKTSIEPSIKEKVQVEYVYQDMNAFTDGLPIQRKKPWGTAHAVLCCKDVIKGPFAVINADDFYGKDAFIQAYTFLSRECNASNYGLIGYDLANTLSENGSVNRGICQTHDNYLTDITECINIHKNLSNELYVQSDTMESIPIHSTVSMNFFCFPQESIIIFENQFKEFEKKTKDNISAEFFIPIVAKHVIKEQKINIHVLPTISQWFGVTYKEDALIVKESISKLINNREYPSKLW